MANILSRISQLSNNESISIGALERKIGASKGVLSRAIANGTDIQAKWLQKIVENYPQYSTEWLIAGRGPMLRSEDTQLASPSVQARFPLRSDHDVALPGLTALFETRQVPVSHIQIPNLPPCDGALYVRGDSMYPLLKSGDIVLYKEVHDNANILYGEMYLLSFTIDGDDYVTIKYLQKADEEGFVRLVSYNPHHSPKDIPVDSIRALALVKASVRFNTMG